MVTRPENGYDAYVTLKLTAMVGGESVSREFNLTILADDGIRAFPSAEGYGQYSKGGRGGQVYHVTNLNASGPGSLQYGVEEMSGARTIVFDVGGVIDLTQYGANLRLKGVKGANVTIAGQTAPYPGITLKGYGLDINSTHDVIIRNIRIRIGDVLEDGIYNQTDPMSIGSTNNLVVDHCTFHWAIDMDFRVAGQNVTFSNMLMGKGLTINSTHEKGGHAYVGAINEGSARVSFIKNMVTDSTQRSPRLVDAEYVDAYNNLLYDCGNGFDVYNYETQGQNSKYNVYQNFMRTGPTQSNKTPLRIGRGRAYAGGVMGYVEDNYYTGENNDSSFIAVTNGIENVPTNGILNFGEANLGKVADLSNITLSDWDNDPRSYDNNNKQNPAGTITYMDYPFPAPRGDVIDIDNNEPGVNNPLVKYALDEDGLGQGMGVTKPARDLYDTMIMAELKAGKVTQTGLTKSQVAPFFDALERRVKEPGVDENGNRTMVPVDYEAHRAVVKDDNAVSGFSYSDPQNYKTGRIWTILQGGGPAVVGSGSGTNNKPINWDSYTDVNRNTNPTATSKYVESYTTDFEIGDWWGEYCGSPGKVLVYTVHDPVSGRFTTTTDYDSIDQTKYEIMSVEPKYIEVKRTVADLIPAQWVYDRDARHADEEGYKPVAPFMINYMLNKYPYLDSYSNYEEFQIAKANGTLSEFDFDHNYTNQEITWDGMGDGIPNWYKEYRGWSTTQYVASNTDPETGYTYLEEYINFMADDEPINIDQSPAKAENFKIIQSKLGYSSVQLSWNTNYRATCVIEYGTEPGKYDKSVALDYSNAPDGYHTYHDISIGALQPDTTYYYRVTTTDELGNTTYSEGEKQQFKTEPLPAGSNIMPTKPTVDDVVPYLNQIRLNWTGNPATDEGYEIYYDTVDHGQDYTAYANKLTGLSLYTNKQIITGLENNIQYYFLVVATNSNGKTPSDVIASTPSGVMYNFNFSEMSYPERDEFIKKQFMYILGGQVSMQPDPDTGKYVLMLLDETNSHGVNTNLRLPVTQTDKMTYEVRLKLLYQKQTDALNGNIFPNQKESSKDSLTKTGEPEHNTWQVNFSQDPNVNEDLDSRKTKLWDSAFSIYFDPYSDPISTEYIDRDVVDVDGNSTHFQGNRYDGTVETPTFKFGTTVIGNGYSIGRTIATSPGPVDDNRPYRLKKLKATGNDKEAYNTILQSPENGHDLIESEISTDKYQLPLMKDVITTYQCESCGNLYYEDAVSTPVAELTTCPNCGEKIILEGEEANFKKVKTETNWSTGYTNPSTYSFKTPYGDAFFSDQADTDKTLHSLWYYEKGSAQFVDLKVVVDIRNNMVSVSLDGNELYKLGQFSKDLDPPYNIGKIELKSRNDGYSWVNVESIKISNGDGTTSIDPPPVQPGATKPISPGGGGGGGGGGSLSTNATPGPEATADPNATAAPAATAAPSTAVYTDLGDVDWAVEAINALSAMGIVNGTGDGKFSPNDNVTRAEYTTMLMRAFGGDTTAAAASFTDVSAGEWYTEPIGKAVALGVVNGYEDGSFGIDDNITREDMMVIAYRTTSALNMAVPETIPYESFADQSSISDYAVEAVEKMYSAEIINGVGDGLLDPKGNATRAQSAKIIYGLINMEGTVNE